VTTRREVPLSGDVLAWVHAELSEIKSRLSLVAQAAEQSRNVASQAADTSHEVQRALSQFDGLGTAVMHAQDDLRALRDVVVRSQDDINHLRQGREELERRVLEESEVVRQDKNAVGRRFTDLERQLEVLPERLQKAEEHSRRNLDMISQLSMRIEVIEGAIADNETNQSYTISTLSRLDQELTRLSATVMALQNEDITQQERLGSNTEMIRRLESALEMVKVETNKIIRIDDRLELVQAERTRHNEQINEIMAGLNTVEGRLNAHDERAALIEARMNAYQEDLRKLRESLQIEREQLGAYLNGLRDLGADFRKREIGALEKEIKDLRARTFNVEPE
jgi:chromosome segregation ATPase